MRVRFLVPVDVPNPEYNPGHAADHKRRMAIYPHREKVVAPPGTEWDDPAARATLVYLLRIGVAEPLDDDARECCPTFTAEQRKEAIERYILLSKGMATGDARYDAETEEEDIEYVEGLGDIEDTELSVFDD